MATRETSYDVRFRKIETRVRAGGTFYRVRWSVAGKMFRLSFATLALADSQRSQLMAAARSGEAFDVESGMPQSRVVDDRKITWWDWATRYVDLKWPHLAPRSRRSVAEALMTPTLVLSGTRGRPDDKLLRAAMFAWGFNTPARQAGPPADEHAHAIHWLEENSSPLASLRDTDKTRAVLAAISLTLTGSQAAPTTIARRRAVFHNALAMAVEHECLESNPLDHVRWRPPKVSEALDPRVVANPAQGRALIEAVGRVSGGRRYSAFFGCLYYSALRPSEAASLTVRALELPPTGWGWLLLSESSAEVSGAWTDSGSRSNRQLKHRARGDVRRVPCPPPLTLLLHRHLEEFGIGDGELFRGPFGGQVTSKANNRLWQEARRLALSEAEFASPLVGRPYDLRHSAVSTWLAAGVDSAQVAAWAGHSVAVLHRVYSHVISGRETLAQQRISQILGLSVPPNGTELVPQE